MRNDTEGYVVSIHGSGAAEAAWPVRHAVT